MSISKKVLLKTSVAALILAIIFKSIDWNSFQLQLLSISPIWFVCSIGVVGLIRLAMGTRWYVLVNAHGNKIDFWKVIYINYIGVSFGLFTPGGIGGDIMRGLLISRHKVSIESIARSILVDRIIGIYTLFLLSSIGLLVSHLSNNQNILPTWVEAVVFLVVILSPFSFIALPYLSKVIPALVKNNSILILRLQRFSDLHESPKTLFLLLVLSSSVQILRCFLMYALFRAYGISIDFVYFLLFSPIVFLAAMIPISPGGLGIREATTIILFGQLGITIETNVAVSLSFQIVQTIVAIPGALVWLFYKPKANESLTQSES